MSDPQGTLISCGGKLMERAAVVDCEYEQRRKERWSERRSQHLRYRRFRRR